MAMTISATAVTATSVTLAFGGLAADGTIDVQISPDPGFAFCVCPILTVPRATPVTIFGLNQRASLFVRCRPRRASGAVEDWSALESFRTADGAALNVAPAAVMIDLAMVVKPETVTTWAGSGAVAGFPVDNLAVDAPVGWKSVDAGGGQYVEARLPGAAIDTIAALNSNMPEAGTVTITASPTQAGLASGVGRVTLVNAQPFRASPNLPGRRGYHGLFRFDATSLPWWRVAFGGVKPANTLYLEHLIFGLNRATKNHAVEKTETPLPKTTIERTRSGVPDRARGLAMRKVSFDIAVMKEAQYETAYGDLIHYENEPVLVVPNSKAGGFLHDRILFGDLTGSRVINVNTPIFTRSFTVESII